MSEEQLLMQLAEGNKTVLKDFYLEHRLPFTIFAQKISTDTNLITDVYQDAIIALHEQAVEGKLTHLKCSLKTYLFSIGKYMLYDKMREQKKHFLEVVASKEVYNYQKIVDDFMNDSPNKYELKLQRAFGKLGKKCKEVLTLFYYRGFTLDEITDTLDYENKNVVKSQKSRCIKKLKELIKEDK